MPKKLADLPVRAVTAVIFGLVFGGVFLFLPPLYFSGLLAIIAGIILFGEWVAFPAWTWLIIPVYPTLPFCFLIYLNQSSVYHQLLYYLFVMVFAHDTGAYITGSLFGKTKIAPSISPKKSWEGGLGGLCFAALALVTMMVLHDKPLPVWFILIFAVSVAVLATVGDFFESWLKRKAGVKNSGSLLPGHGGLLDRFDSILAVAFLFFIFRNQLILFLL
jgi:CDP-diglyceride synthetase